MTRRREWGEGGGDFRFATTTWLGGGGARMDADGACERHIGSSPPIHNVLTSQYLCRVFFLFFFNSLIVCDLSRLSRTTPLTSLVTWELSW